MCKKLICLAICYWTSIFKTSVFTITPKWNSSIQRIFWRYIPTDTCFWLDKIVDPSHPTPYPRGRDSPTKSERGWITSSGSRLCPNNAETFALFCCSRSFGIMRTLYPIIFGALYKLIDYSIGEVFLFPPSILSVRNWSITLLSLWDADDSRENK